MEIVAKELAQNGELGLDEQTLLRLFECKTDKLINSSTGGYNNNSYMGTNPHFAFDDGPSVIKKTNYNNTQEQICENFLTTDSNIGS